MKVSYIDEDGKQQECDAHGWNLVAELSFPIILWVSVAIAIIMGWR